MKFLGLFMYFILTITNVRILCILKDYYNIDLTTFFTQDTAIYTRGQYKVFKCRFWLLVYSDSYYAELPIVGTAYQMRISPLALLDMQIKAKLDKDRKLSGYGFEYKLLLFIEALSS